MNTYYKLSNKALAFDVNKEVDLIRFNHYLMQKENIQRLKGNLTKGCLELSSKIISEDMKIDINKAKRLVKKFLELGIIKAISISTKKGIASIYSYCTFASENEPNCEPNCEPKVEPQYEPKKISNFNTCSRMNELENEPNVEPISEPINEPSKKELLKISCCSCLEEPHKNLEGEEIKGLYQQKLNLEDEKVKLVKSYGFSVSNAQEKLIQGLDKDRLLQAIELSVAQEGKSFSYIYKVYLNNKKAPSTGIEDALSSSTNKSTKTNIKKSIADKKRKDKSIYMCKTMIEVDGKLVDTDDLSSDEFEKIIQERQKKKWA